MLRNPRRAVIARRITGIALVVLVPLLVVVLTVRPGQGGDTQTVRVRFDELQGLAKVNRDVRIDGVDVGTITQVERVDDDAVLTLQVEQKAGPVYQDATAELRPHAAFEGDAYVDLDPGTAGAGALGDRVIPKAQTSVYVPLDRALRVLDAPRREAVQKTAGELSTAATPETERGLQDTLRALPDSARATGPALRAAQGPSGDDLRPIIRDLSVTMPELGDRAAELGDLLRDMRRTLAAIRTQNGEPLDATLVALPRAITQLRDGAEQLPGMMSRVRATADRLGPTLAELPPTLRELRPLLREAGPALDGTPELAANLQLVLDDLARGTPATRALVAEILPIVAQIEDELVPNLTQPTRVSKEPAYRALLSAFTAFTGAFSRYHPEGARPYSGAGHYLRVTADLQQAIASAGDSRTLGAAIREGATCRSRLARDAEGRCR